jgi:uncharacterized protein (DUF1697 family)
MQSYIAFIAGLPSGRNGVSMETLRSQFARLGFLNVETYLTTGNIKFDTAPVGVIGPLEAQISRHLRNSLAAEGIWTFIRTPEELSRIVADVPFPEEETTSAGNSLFVILLSGRLDERAARRLRVRRNDVDDLRVHGNEIYWLRRSTNEPHPPPPLAEMLDAPATVRSFSTLARLAGKYSRSVRGARQAPPADDSTRSEQSRR